MRPVSSSSPIVTLLRTMLAVGTVSGCAGPSAAISGGYCAPPSRAPNIVADEPPPRGSSREDFMGALIGLPSLLHDDAHDERTRVRVLERVEEARLAIAATAAELDCEAKRAGQAADLLERRQDSTVQALTFASIAAAAATGVATVFASTTNSSAWTQNGIAIGGGVVTAGFGVASLYMQPTIHFEHRDNLLADVLHGPARSANYPPVVWGYLTTPEFSNDQVAAIRVKLVQRWRLFHHVGDDPKTVALLFGHGGDYDLDTLRIRAMMLAQVRSEVDLSDQEIAVLVAHLHAR